MVTTEKLIKWCETDAKLMDDATLNDDIRSAAAWRWERNMNDLAYRGGEGDTVASQYVHDIED